jgi:hypothetical protein
MILKINKNLIVKIDLLIAEIILVTITFEIIKEVISQLILIIKNINIFINL